MRFKGQGFDQKRNRASTIIRNISGKGAEMAKAISKPKISVSITFEVDEEEARALDALAGYGDNEFIKMFYNQLGKSYMQPYEAGLRRFLESVRSAVAPALNDVDVARKAVQENRKS